MPTEGSPPPARHSDGQALEQLFAFGHPARTSQPCQFEAVDFYLAQLWLAPEEPDAVLRVGSIAARTATFEREGWLIIAAGGAS